MILQRRPRVAPPIRFKTVEKQAVRELSRAADFVAIFLTRSSGQHPIQLRVKVIVTRSVSSTIL
jgi:hypothetical protein